MNRLWFRLFLAILTVLVVAVATAWVLATRSASEEFAGYVEDVQTARVQRVQQMFRRYRMQNGSWTGAQQLTQRTAELVGEHIVVVDGDGVVVADSLNQYLGQPASPTWQGVRVPLDDDTTSYGAVYLSPTRPAGLADVRQRLFIEARNRSLLAASLVGLIAAAALSILVARRIARPIEAVTAAATRMQSGELRQQLTADPRDPEEVKALDRAFVALSESIDRTEQLRRNMVSDIAHELRTPLSHVRGYLEAIQDGVLEPTPEILGILDHEARSLARLVDDLQELSLAEAGQLRIAREHVLAVGVIESALRAIRAQPGAAELELVFDVFPKDLTLHADPVRVEQILRNLLSNAIRHTSPGGRITVSARRSLQGYAEVSVRDTGSGIAPEDLPFIFERFYRADAARDRATGGAGIGLTIARQLVRSHGGDIAVQSTPGVGTTFTFTIPVAGGVVTPPQPLALTAGARPRLRPSILQGAIAGICAGIIASLVEAYLVVAEGARTTFGETLLVALPIDGVVFGVLGAALGLLGALARRSRWASLRPIRLAFWAIALAAPVAYVSLVHARRFTEAVDFTLSDVVPGWLPMVMLAVGITGALCTYLVVFAIHRLLERTSMASDRLATIAVLLLLLLGAGSAALQFGRLSASLSLGGAPASPAASSDLTAFASERPRPNVLLVTFDSLRADHTSVYGYERPTTPMIDQLAAQGVRFASAFVQQPHIAASHASILTGLYPKHHGVRGFAADRLSPDVPTLAEVLAAQGYQTAAFFSWPSLGDPFSGLGRGFQTYADLTVNRPQQLDEPSVRELLMTYRRLSQLLALPARLGPGATSGEAGERTDGRADVTTRAAVEWLDQHGDHPFFLWVHYFDPHAPYSAPEPHARLFAGSCEQCDRDRTMARLRNGESPDGADWAYITSQYDAEIHFADAQFGELLDRLTSMGIRDRTLVVATGSNGVRLGEPSLDHRSGWLQDEGIRVPLVAALPSVLPAGEVVDNPVQLVDIAPTVLDALRIDARVSLDGHSFVGRSDALKPSERVAFSILGDDSRVAIMTSDWKLIYARESESVVLYDRHRDPHERDDLAEAEPAVVGDLLGRLMAWLNGEGS